MTAKINIAIDGFASCGKSTLAKAIAKKFGMIYIDTGAMYRAVTLYCLKNRIIQENEVREEDVVNELDKIHVSFCFNPSTGRSETLLNGKNVEQDIRTHAVSSMVSKISQIKQVREKMIVLQRKIGENKGVVMDGRDIGTNVFPDAEIKFFVTANIQTRATRRFQELNQKDLSLQQVMDNLIQRDFEDSTRENNPLKKAEDAIEIDNSTISIEQQNLHIFNIIQQKINHLDEDRN